MLLSAARDVTGGGWDVVAFSDDQDLLFMLTREDPLETKSLVTPRLTLIPATTALVQAEIGPQDLFSQALGAKVPENWPPELLVDVLPFFLEQLKQDPALVGWLSWYWVLRREATEEA